MVLFDLRAAFLPHVECAKAVLSKQALEQRAQRVQAGSA
jgi:hypothetical protein